MNADSFRQLFEYHFSLNRYIWDDCIVGLSDVQFKQKLGYSVGSVRNQVVHLMNIEERWFCGLRGVEVPGFLNPVQFSSREKIRRRWDGVEGDMRAYLAELSDEDLARPFYDQMQVWQALFQVLNHGTDHRAQLLAMLEQLGAPTFAQDYALYIEGKINRPA